jgi:hypothetical protein
MMSLDCGFFGTSPKQRRYMPMLNALLACGLVMVAVAIPLAFYWKAEKIESLLRKFNV